MNIYIMRHGNASYSTKYKEQILTDRGQNEVRTISSYLKNKIKIEKILHSPLIRAQETAQIMQKSFPDAKIELSKDILPHSRFEPIIEEIEYCTEEENLLIVSHMPFVYELSLSLTNRKDHSKFSFFPTAALLHLKKKTNSYKVIDFYPGIST